MRADDDDALTWDEVEDSTHAATPLPKPPAVVEPVETAPVVEPVETSPAPVVEPVETKPPETSPVVEPVETNPTSPPTSSFLLVSYGILAGAYLLYTVGWVIAIRQVTFVEVDTLARILSGGAQVFAIASPAIWFGGAFVLTRTAKPHIRLLLLIAGLVATIPLPFILLGASS